jgi:hypothetical protein
MNRTRAKKVAKKKGGARGERINTATPYVASRYVQSKHIIDRYAEEGAADRAPGATSTMKNFPKSFIPMPELLDD